MGSTTAGINIERAHSESLMGPGFPGTRVPYHDPTHPTYRRPDNLTEEQYQQDREALEDAFIQETNRRTPARPPHFPDDDDPDEPRDPRGFGGRGRGRGRFLGSPRSSDGNPLHVRTKELRINMPKPFDGTPGKLRNFLQECTLYLQLNDAVYTSDEAKIGYILSLFEEGTASI